jgi:hypothetical protein
MSKDLTDRYREIIDMMGLPLSPPTVAGDWWLRFYILPSFQPETIYDLTFQQGVARFYETRFIDSVWGAIIAAKNNPSRLEVVSSLRRCADLPVTHALNRLVENEYVFRLRSAKCEQLDGTAYVARQVFHDRKIELEAWCTNMPHEWNRLLDSIHEACRLLPKPNP